MKRRRVIVVLVGLAALALVVGPAVVWWPDGTRPCLAKFERVQKGMTFEEVCTTAGGPPGDYSQMGYTHEVRPNEHYWIADDGLLHIRVDAAGRVAEVQVHEISRTVWPSWWDRFLARLGL
jgi:hypothetical protein